MGKITFEDVLSIVLCVVFLVGVYAAIVVCH